MKPILIVGTRPQLIKAGALLKEWPMTVYNTGQHYKEMNDLYQGFKCKNLHATTIPRMMVRIEKMLRREKPDLVLVIGDTNSTLAGALTAKKLGIKVCHIEAGCRNYSDILEEINRVATDHLSDYHCCSTRNEVANLKKEGIEGFLTGDLMADIVKGEWSPKGYVLATFHRPENVDTREQLELIVNDLKKFGLVIWPIHPRAKKNLKKFKINTDGILIRKPASLKEMIELECGADLIITDSGGVQRDAYMLGVPYLVIREKNEWKLKGSLGKDVAKKIRRYCESSWNN